MHQFTISGRLIDLFQRRIYPAEIRISNGIIESVTEKDYTTEEQYILPGFTDAHVHIESSMLVPQAFGRMAVVHGTVATVSDPHEIANVCGVEGVLYMIENSRETPLKIFYGAPSCVPATFFETAGAVIDAADIKKLLQQPDIWYLTEMMNYPGVLHGDKEVMAKIEAAKLAGKPVDGHAPGLRGAEAAAYAAAGITTDHECFIIEEAQDKIAAGMKILIREGSAAKNFEALAPLFRTHPDKLMFCSDDKHPDDLVISHINALVKRSLAKGYDLFDVLFAACVHPVQHYGLPVGLLRKGDPADFIVTDNPASFKILKTYINGQLVAENGTSLLPVAPAKAINNFKARLRVEKDFHVKAASGAPEMRIIDAIEGQLVTGEIILPAKVENGLLVSDTDRDILKICVVNRYAENEPAASAFIRNFGIRKGAMASTVAHDCHNIIAVGVDDAAICAAVNALVASKGGIAVTDENGVTDVMPLPVGGLMTTEDGYIVAGKYAAIDARAKALGTTLKAPFMTLSFMALLVIPSLKLSDKGLFDGNKFSFTPLEV
ncbi:adenine deaminase [Chitinophagaceae bacterium MMS25-I14]